MVRMACGPLYIFPWGLWHSITLGRLGQKLLSLWKQLSSETFVSIVLLCPENMILSFAQFMSNYLVDPYRMLPDICHVRYYGKKAQNLSFTGSFCLFFSKVCVFNKFIGPKNALTSSRVIARKPYGPWRIVSWFCSCSVTRKNRSNNFFHWKGCPFFSKFCVFNNLLSS